MTLPGCSPNHQRLAERTELTGRDCSPPRIAAGSSARNRPKGWGDGNVFWNYSDAPTPLGEYAIGRSDMCIILRQASNQKTTPPYIAVRQFVVERIVQGE